MHRRNAAIVVVLALLTGASSAIAQAGERLIADVGGRSVKLLVPDGYCLLDEQVPADFRLVSFIRRVIAGTNELLLIAADCVELQQIHDGKRERLGKFVEAMHLLVEASAPSGNS